MDAILNYKADQSEDLYGVLECDEYSTTEQITAEYKARVLSCHPDKHPGDQQAAESFQQIQRAKEILTDPVKRRHYDSWRHSGIAMSYADWCALKDSVKTSMHWATERKENCMLEDANTYENQNTSLWNQWNREKPSEMLRKFRSYEF